MTQSDDWTWCTSCRDWRDCCGCGPETPAEREARWARDRERITADTSEHLATWGSRVAAGIVERRIDNDSWLEPEVCYAPVRASLCSDVQQGWVGIAQCPASP